MTLPIGHKIVKVILEMDNGQTEELSGSSITAEISTLCLREGAEEWELVARGISPGIAWREKADSRTLKLRDRIPRKEGGSKRAWVDF